MSAAARYRGRLFSYGTANVHCKHRAPGSTGREARAEHPFDRATTVSRHATGVATATTSDEYWAFVGPFGGITAASILRAILDHPERAGDPLSLTTNLCAPVARGPFQLHTRLVRATRSTQHWTVELSQPDGGVSAIASVVLATGAKSWAHQPATFPKVPAFDATPVYQFSGTVPAWISQYQFRFVSGAPGFDTGASTPNDPTSLVWMRDRVPRRLDALSMAAISDAFFGRIFQALGRVVPFGTVSMTTYFHADGDDLAAEDATTVLGAATGRSFSKNYGDQIGESSRGPRPAGCSRRPPRWPTTRRRRRSSSKPWVDNTSRLVPELVDTSAQGFALVGCRIDGIRNAAVHEAAAGHAVI